MCREEAHRLFARKKELDAMGVRLLCVVKEAIPEQIDQFVPKYWGEESDSDLYLDEELQFFKFLGGGEEQSKGLFALASSAVRSANSRAGAYLKSVGGDSNLTGEGWILGKAPRAFYALQVRPSPSLSPSPSPFYVLQLRRELGAASRAAAVARRTAARARALCAPA